MSAVCLLLTIAPAWQHHQLLLPHALMRTPARATQQPAMLLGVRSKRRKKGEADWAERLDKDLGEAADLARRGGAVSHALLKAREAANEASSAAWESKTAMETEIQAAKDAAARALLEADAAKKRAERAEKAEAAASDALAKVKAELKQGKKEASDIVLQLDDAFERTQDSLRRAQQALKETEERAVRAEERAEKALAGQPSIIAAAVESAVSVAVSEAVGEAVGEVEEKARKQLEELEGCLVDAVTERDANLCRAITAEEALTVANARIGRKRRMMRDFLAKLGGKKEAGSLASSS